MIYTVSLTDPALDLILTVPAIEFEVVLRSPTRCGVKWAVNASTSR